MSTNQTKADIYQDFYGTPTLPELGDATFAALGVSGDANEHTLLGGDRAWKYNNLKPRPLGARWVPIGDSITAGAGSVLTNPSANNVISRIQAGGWVGRLSGAHPDRYFRLNNAGVGGDIIGGLGKIKAGGAAGTNTLTVTLTAGIKPYHTAIPVYVGGYTNTLADALYISSVVALSATDYYITFATPFVRTHAVGDECGWGMHGRLQGDVLNNNPEIVTIAAGTNDMSDFATLAPSGVMWPTATEIVNGLKEMGQRVRDYGAEPIFMEILPRPNFQSQVVQVNDLLRSSLWYRLAGHEGPYHLIPTHDLFTSSTGTYKLSGSATQTSGTATGGGATTITVAGAGWTVNAFAGYQVRIVTSGTGGVAGQRRIVTSNTATTLTVSVAWTTNPGAGDTFVIENMATGGSLTTLVRTGAGWAVDQWKNYLLRIVGGTGAGQSIVIDSNTATTLTFSGVPVAPDATSVFWIESDTADGVHPSDFGHQKYADRIHSYMDKLPLRLQRIPRSAIDADPTNGLQRTLFMTSFAGTYGQIPTGWTENAFFNVGTVSAIEAPGPFDNILGQWFTLTSTNGTGSLGIQQVTNPLPAVGQLVRMTVRVKTTGVSNGWTATVFWLDGAYNLDVANGISMPLDQTFITPAFRVTSTLTSIVRFTVAPNGGSGKLWVAEPFFQIVSEA